MDPHWLSIPRITRGLGALLLVAALPAQAQVTTYVELTGSDHPLSSVDVGAYSNPEFADIDGDGDLDGFFGESTGTILFYENTASSTSATFSQVTGASNPFDGIDVGSFAGPRLADIDNDGDLDAFIGEANGGILYYENTGTSASATFTAQTGASNPFDGVSIGFDANIELFDIDADSDLDALLTAFDGTVYYYENTGTASSPTFTQQTGGSNPFNGVDVGSESHVASADLDSDGDIDVFLGTDAGTLLFYLNTGSAASPTFTQQTGANNPMDGVDVGTNSKPVLADLDGDSDADLVIGRVAGTFALYRNGVDATAPTFVSGYPQSSNLAQTSFDVTVQLDEPGTAYFVVLADGATAPSVAQVQAGQDASSSAALSSGNFSVASASTSASGSATGLTLATDYDVYVVAQDDESTPNVQSSVTLLEVTTDGVAAPTLVAHGGLTAPPFTPTLDWNDVSGAATYQIQLATDSGFSSIVQDATVSVSTYTATTLSDATYYWRVRAIDSSSNQSAWSSTSSFTIIPTFAQWVFVGLAVTMAMWAAMRRQPQVVSR